MSRDEIIAMARDAGFTANIGYTDRDGTHHPAINALGASVPVEWLERFAALVEAKEREACAQVCEENQEESLDIARGALVTEQGASHERSESA
jgi:hypothetical protein